MTKQNVADTFQLPNTAFEHIRAWRRMSEPHATSSIS